MSPLWQFILIFFGTGGVATAIVVGIFNRSKTKAEAVKTTNEGQGLFVSGQVEFVSGGYQKLIVDLQNQMIENKKYNEDQIKALQDTISSLRTTMEDHEKQHALVLQEKDKEISSLKDRIEVLEDENEKMKAIMKSNDITL